ncbi:MAG: hypothetical protein GWO23_08565, partial [Gammaproteobacteria bacterium]|nr:hypothetical protein [Gammaproteobacteria bacterium]NIW40525.1 hypothetical protein [candidate division Zixibacteria bacterium]
PGERYEILVDLNRELEMKADVWEGESYTALRMKPEGTEGRFYEHPSEFMYEPAVPGPSAKTRPFRLE